MTTVPLRDADYAALADFRHALRQFMVFSEAEASGHGLTAQQHQALLAIRGTSPAVATIGYVADRLCLKPHSATGLVDRLEKLGLVSRRPSPHDRRQAQLELTEAAMALLGQLSAAHREEIRRLRPMLVDLLARVDGQDRA